CRHRGGQTGARRHRLHRRPARLRPQDHPARPERPGTTPSPVPGGDRTQPAGTKKRGGDRPLGEKLPELVPAFHLVLEDHTAGSPMRAEVIWTDLTPREIQADLREHDVYVSEDTLRQLLRDQGSRRRQMLKYLDMDQHPDRDAQFVNIARLKEEYL